MKSKLGNANEKIAKTVVEGYKKIENGVTGSFKKMSDKIVDVSTLVENKFVESYLTKDGETVSDAKKRLKDEEEARKLKHEEEARKLKHEEEMNKRKLEQEERLNKINNRI